MSALSESVCICGIGACTPVGATALSSAAAVRAGLCGFADHPYLIDKHGDAMVVARIPSLASELSGRERFVAMARMAIGEALASIAVAGDGRERPPLYLAVASDRFPAEEESPGGGLGSESIVEGLEVGAVFTTATAGNSAGLRALEVACRHIRAGRVSICITGGVDSYLDPHTLDRIEAAEELHSTRNAWGFVPGEAAAFCLLASEATANRLRIPVLGRILAVGAAREDVRADGVRLGHALTEAIDQVLAVLPPSVVVADVICDLNGEPVRSDEFGFAIARRSDRFADPGAFVAPGDCWGDIGVASGPAFVILATLAMQKGYAPGSHILVLTSGVGDCAAALIFNPMRGDGATAWR